MKPADDIALLAQRAHQAARAGDEAGALAQFQAVLEREPAHLGALSYLAMQAFRRGAHADSLALLERALVAAPADPVLLRNRAAVHAAAGEHDAAVEDLLQAQAAEPGNPLNPMQRGALLEDAGDLDAALVAYNQGFKLDTRLGRAMHSDLLPMPLPVLAERRRAAALRWLGERFAASIEAARVAHPGLSLAHAEACLQMHRRERPQEQVHAWQRPHELLVPDLEPIAWYRREHIPWAAALEAQTAAIRAEYLAVAGGEGFRPYIDEPPERSAAWMKIARQPTWNSFFLYRKAKPVADNLARCPATLAALAGVPLCRWRETPTELFFSVLAPGAHIPPHFGLTNAKCVVHLPLIVPPGCSIRVGEETRGWTEGQVLAFDDSFEHEAMNPGTEPRVVLIFEVWNPQLNPAEVMAIGGMLDAILDFKHL